MCDAIVTYARLTITHYPYQRPSFLIHVYAVSVRRDETRRVHVAHRHRVRTTSLCPLSTCTNHQAHTSISVSISCIVIRSKKDAPANQHGLPKPRLRLVATIEGQRRDTDVILVSCAHHRGARSSVAWSDTTSFHRILHHSTFHVLSVHGLQRGADRRWCWAWRTALVTALVMCAVLLESLGERFAFADVKDAAMTLCKDIPYVIVSTSHDMQ